MEDGWVPQGDSRFERAVELYRWLESEDYRAYWQKYARNRRGDFGEVKLTLLTEETGLIPFTPPLIALAL